MMYMMYFLPSPHFAKSVPCSVSLAFVCSYKFPLETYGGLGKSARKLIKLIASAAEDKLQMLSEEE